MTDQSTARRALEAPTTTDLLAVVAAAAAPVVLTTLAFVAGAVAGLDVSSVGQVGAYGVYAAANLPVVVGVVALLGRDRVAALAPVGVPSARTLGVTLAAFVVGVAVYFPVQALNDALGLTMTGFDYSLSDPVALAVVSVGAVVVAPVVEEFLFRGLVLGHLLERDWHPALAGAASILLFAVIHFPNFGAGGVLFIVVWSTLPTALRIRYDDLAPGILMHALNNLWAYVLLEVLFA